MAFLGCLYEAIEFDRLDKLQNESDDDVSGLIQFMATWRETGSYLARQFIDYEPGIHWSQIGMQSGTTGINTIRAYSMTKQEEIKIPEGAI